MARELLRDAMRCPAIILAVTLPASGWAIPLTMSFDGLDDGLEYVENGITASSAERWGRVEWGAGFAFIERSPLITGAVSFVDFTAGSLFTPVSFDLRPVKSNYCATLRPGDFGCGSELLVDDDDPSPYIWASGFLGDALVSSFGFYRPSSLLWETIDLSSLGLIDRLRLEVKSPYELGLPGICNGGQGCGKFEADNITIQVPEPGALLLLSSALAGLALTRRKRAK